MDKHIPGLVPALQRGGGGGEANPLNLLGARIERRGMSVARILCDLFVGNLFGVFQDLHGCTLGCAVADVYRARGSGDDDQFPTEVAEVLKWSCLICSVPVAFSWGADKRCWSMHREGPPGNTRKRRYPNLVLTSTGPPPRCQPA